MIRQATYGFAGMNQDSTKSKRNPGHYFEASNIRITPTEDSSLGSLTIEKGNGVVFEITTGLTIIGAVDIDKYIVLFATDNAGKDEIWRVDVTNNYNKTLLFNGNLNFSTNNYISAVPSYENENLQKVFWVDGINQLRFINILNPPSVDYPELLDVVPSFNISQPKLETISYGGLHTSGRIQYAYNLIIKNGQQTAISPFSQLISLKTSKKGGDVNDVVGQINNCIISGIDTKFDIIRVYAIKYTSYNQNPVVSLIVEEEIGESNVFRFSDDGNVIYNISLPELLFLGGTPLIPATIESKKNVLLLGNITEQYFDINTGLNPGDSGYFDTRAYRFPKTSTTTPIGNSNRPIEQLVFTANKYLINSKPVPKTHDCIIGTLPPSTVTQQVKNTVPLLTIPVSQIIDEESAIIYNRYMFENLPTSLSGVHYLDVTVKGYDVTNDVSFNISSTFEFNVDESLNFITSFINKINSKTFASGGYSVSAVKADASNDVWFFIKRNNLNASNIEVDDAISKAVAYTQITVTSSVTQEMMYKVKSFIYGASGEDIEWTISTAALTDKTELLKAGEIYRVGVRFYNKFGQVTQPYWSTDLKIPTGVNLKNDQVTLTVTLKNLAKLTSQGVVGYRAVRVLRDDADKTILDQGIISSSVYQLYDRESIDACQDTTNTNSMYTGLIPPTVEKSKIDAAIKIPTPLFREKNDVLGYFVDNLGRTYTYSLGDDSRATKINKLEDKGSISQNDFLMGADKIGNKLYDATRVQPFSEIFATREGKDRNDNTGIFNKSVTIQDTKLFQMYSPEAVINRRDIKGIDSFKVIGKLNAGTAKSWGKKFSTDTQILLEELTKYNGIGLYDIDSDNGKDLEAPTFWSNLWAGISGFFSNKLEREYLKTYFNENGLIGPTGDDKTYIEYQYGREFTLDSYSNNKYEFLHNPIYVGQGERGIIYDPIEFKFNNDLKTILIEANQRDSDKIWDQLDDDDYCQMLSGVNSVGNNCYLFAEKNKTTLESLIGSEGDAILVEFQRTLANQYGGNTYEARSRNSYIDIGDYQSILNLPGITSYRIEHPGDIWVNTFRFARILPNLSKVFSSRFTSICEIVEVPVESSLDLSARSDYSSEGWNSIFHPQFEDYHRYNRVYSQANTSTISTPNVFTFEPVKTFTNRINATKFKTSGEIVDGWTDILLNEELYLNGKYGKLIKILSTGNLDIAVQEGAVAALQIQPRIQQVTNDGIGIELGTGQVLYNYEYISTSTGSTNPRAVFKSPSSVYFVDINNKTINRIYSGEDGVSLTGLTDTKGMHSWATKNILDKYKESINVIGEFDHINNDAYFIFDSDFCIRFNEQSDTFVDIPPLEECNLMFKSKSGLYSTKVNGNNNKVWKHFIGDVGSYYGTVYDSYITLLVAPEPYNEVVFNNMGFISELFDSSNNDVFTEGWYDTKVLPLKSIHCWNNYQDSTEIPFEYKTNIIRRNRNWSVILPRDYAVKRDRLRGEWLFIKLTISNSDNNRLILHDVNVLYS